jgi:hypothetical protein
LNKAYDAVTDTSKEKRKEIFTREEAIADFGVGKNMVAAIKHWALTTGILSEPDGHLEVTPLGEFLLGPDGVDPYLESPASLWLLHWNIATNHLRATTWYWAYGYYASLVFDQEKLLTEITQLGKDRGWKRMSATTLKRDVECFVKTYATSTRRSGADITEDSLESPLAELALIKPTGFRGSYQFQRGAKPSLPDEIFAYSLLKFWESFTEAKTLSMEAIAFEPGSPGRVFKLDEESVTERLVRIENSSHGLFRWTDTAGLSQVLRTEKRFRSDSLGPLLRGAYGPERKAA